MTPCNLIPCTVLLTSILTVAGCRAAPTLELKRDIAADIKAINELLDQNIAAWNSNDAAAVAATFAGDAILMEPNLAALEGKQAIQAWYRAFLKENVVKCAIIPLETQVAGDWGYQRGNYTAVFTPKFGQPIEVAGKYLDVVKRQPDGSWKIYRGTLSSNNPPPSSAGEKK